MSHEGDMQRQVTGSESLTGQIHEAAASFLNRPFKSVLAIGEM